MKNIAVFASGAGSNFKVIHDQIQLGNIFGQIILVVSNNPNCGAIIYAKEHKLPILIVNSIKYPNSDLYESRILKVLGTSQIDLICLAGYLKLLPNKVVTRYKNQILNIHPSLLPDFGGKGFYGMKVHEAVIKAKVSTSGATVHFVDAEYDHGLVIAQSKVVVFSSDTSETLAKRVLQAEHKLYSMVVKAFCEDKIIYGKNKPIIEVFNEN